MPNQFFSNALSISIYFILFEKSEKSWNKIAAPQIRRYKDALSSVPHCDENPIYVFSEKELRGLIPNFHIHGSVSDLYIPRIGPHIFMQQNRQTDFGNI